MVLVSGSLEGGGEQESLSFKNMKGVLLGLGGATLFAVSTMVNKGVHGFPPYLKALIQLLAAGMPILLWLVFTGGFSMECFSVESFPSLLILTTEKIFRLG